MRYRPNRVCPPAFEKAKAVTAKYVSLCKARRKRLGCLHKGQRRRMTAEESLHWLRRRSVRPAGRHSAEELEKLLSIARGKTVSGMAHDIRMHMFRKIETNCQAARIGIGNVVRNLRK